VDLCELLQVVLQEGDLLFLGIVAKALFTVEHCSLKTSLQLFGLKEQEEIDA